MTKPIQAEENASTRLTTSQDGPAALPRERRSREGPRLFIIIDDVGYNIRQLQPFLDLPFPLTFAVLPGLPYSTKATTLIKAAGKSFILHQPMESLAGLDPGPGAIFLTTKPIEAAKIVEKNLASLPGAEGINNHEGSAVTRNEALMAAVMGVAKKRGIYYLDSLTISGTATSAVANREGISYWERDVFLDNSPDRLSIIRYVDLGKKKAEKSGAAVMIGHVWSAELAQTLSELYPQLVAEGYSLSTISRYMLEETDVSTGGLSPPATNAPAAVVEDGRRILSDIVATQIPFHAKYQGVVPEIASRKHTEWIYGVVEAALRKASIDVSCLEGIAVTAKPGLVGSLLVGISFAKVYGIFPGPALCRRQPHSCPFSMPLSSKKPIEYPFL